MDNWLRYGQQWWDRRGFNAPITETITPPETRYVIMPVGSADDGDYIIMPLGSSQAGEKIKLP